MWGADNLYRFAPNTQSWVDFLRLFTLEQLLTVGIGPFAEESIPAREPERNFTQEESKKLNKIGVCHTCGATGPGTKTGNFVGDHQPNTGLRQAKELGIHPRDHYLCLLKKRKKKQQTLNLQVYVDCCLLIST